MLRFACTDWIGAMRRLLILASAMVFFDVAFFAAIAPLLPTYVDELGLTQGAGGDPLGLLRGRDADLLAAGGLRRQPVRAAADGDRRPAAARRAPASSSASPRRSLLLDGARFVQGVAGALIWSGAMTWLITTAPEEERGSVIGTALGTAVAGALLGPALGALAASVGTEPVFGSVLVVAIGARRSPPRGWRRRARPSSRACAKSSRRCSAGRWSRRRPSSPCPR